MVLNPVKQEDIHSELVSMIKALERFKENRPAVTLVKTGVSSSALPKFLVNQDIVSEQKRMHIPSPMGTEVLAADRPIIVDQITSLKRQSHGKKVLKKSLKLNQLKANQTKRNKENTAKQTNLYRGKATRKRVPACQHMGFWRWLEGIAIKMSKTSLVGLFFVLLLLGGVFFGVGFLTGITNVKQAPLGTPQSWQQANQSNGDTATDAKPNPLLAAAGTMMSSVIAHKVTALESKLGGGALNKAVEQVPDSLKPFAMHMQNKFSQRAQGVVEMGGRAVQNVFRPSRFGTTPPPAVPMISDAGASTSSQVPSNQSAPHQYAPQHIESMRQYSPSQQVFRQAGQIHHHGVNQPVVLPERGAPVHQQGYTQPQPMQQQMSQPVAQRYQPVPPVVMQSQPYGVSHPYGYSQGNIDQPKMVGMG